MNESMDRVLAEWLHEGPESGPREGLERALAATRRVGQRPGWTLPGRWIPMELTMERTRSLRPVLAIATLALLLVALAATALFIAGQLPSQMRNGAVVFARDGDLFIADQLGGAPRPLVAGPEGDSDPAFSHQGDRVAFVRHAPDGTQIMTVRSDGTGITLLASGLPSKEVRLGWAPDGRALLASGQVRSDRGMFEMGPGSHLLYLIASDGSGSRRVNGSTTSAVGPGAWRPDGRHIAFLGIVPRGGSVAFIADADGTNPRQLRLGTVEPDGGLAWSPDGTQLSFTSRQDGEDVVHINVADIDADGKVMGVRQLPLAEDVGAEFLIDTADPAWSPGGSHIAIGLWRQGPSDGGRVGIFEADGSGYRVVGPAVIGSLIDLVWSPDGRSLVITMWDYSSADDQVRTTWSLDVATGEAIEVQTPVDSWLHLAP